GATDYMNFTTVIPGKVATDKNWSEIRNACIKSNNYKTFTALTIDICKENCTNEDGIDCQSIEYNLVSHTCSISDTRSTSDDYTEPCHVRGWEYMERRLDAG
ncbi:unnamed protein product, partial [Meganyctiphanes norvegica]